MGGATLQVQARGGIVAAAEVVEARAGALWVELETGERLECDVLVGGARSSNVRPGERVLVLVPEEPRRRACVLGVIGPYLPSTRPSEPGHARRIEGKTIVIEAGTRLELRVGESAIVINADGRILIHGKNVLTRAKALNKIRGAAVSIN